MEKTRDIKGFKEYKTNMRAVTDGVNLLARHAGMLLKACGPLMLVVSLVWAWTSLSMLSAVNQFMTTDISVTGFPTQFVVPAVLQTLLGVVALAQFYSLFQGYVENGFIPQVNYKSIWKLTLQTLKRNTLIVWLWLVFVAVLFSAIVFYLAVLSEYTLILTIPMNIFLSLWVLNLLADFHVQDCSLMRSISRSMRTTFQGFFSFLVVYIGLNIVLTLLVSIILVPGMVGSIISVQASLSLAMEDAADMPGYFNATFFIFSTISGFLLIVLSAFALSCWTMLYGAVSCRNSKKFQSLSQKD